MANRYANLVGSNKIKDEYGKINDGFQGVQDEMDTKAAAADAQDTRDDLDAHIGSGGTAHANAVASGAAGFMTGTDKAKLDGVAAGAEVNQNAFATVAVSGQSDVVADQESDTLTLVGGVGITITTNPTTDTVTITATGEAAPAAHGSTHVEDGADPIPLGTDTNAGILRLIDSTNSSETDAAASAASVKSVQDDLDDHAEDYTLHIAYAAASGSANTYTVSLSPALGAYTAGVAVAVKINADNTGASTININSLGAKNILDSKGNNLTSGKLVLGSIYTLRYNGTAFILQGEGGGGTATAAKILDGETATVDTGDVTGTMPNRAGDTAALSSSVSSTTLKLVASNGYRDGVDDAVTITDSNFIAANVLQGKSIFGLSGTATSDANATAGDIMTAKTAYVNGVKLTGTSTAKLFASGTVTSSSTQLSFTDFNGNSTSQYYVNVTGLNFPSGIAQITLYRSISSYYTTIYNINLLVSGTGGNNAKILIVPPNGSGTVGFVLTGNATVTSSGFQLPVYTTSVSLSYMVWGQ